MTLEVKAELQFASAFSSHIPGDLIGLLVQYEVPMAGFVDDLHPCQEGMPLKPAAAEYLEAVLHALNVQASLQSILRHVHPEDLAGIAHHGVAKGMDPKLRQLIQGRILKTKPVCGTGNLT